MESDASLTERLQLFMQGDREATESMLAEILPTLREIARGRLEKERYGAPICKTELISELWVSQLSKGGWEIRDRGHFYALASLAMRRILVDLARKRLAGRRGGGEATLPLIESGHFMGTSVTELERIVEIGILMDALEAESPDAARMVDMQYFSGFTLEEIVRETGLTEKQVRRRLEKGMHWLKRKLRARKRDGPSHAPDGGA